MASERMTPAEYRARLTRWAAAAIPDLLRDMGKVVFTRIAARAIGTYMRDAKGEGRRSRTDSGPLRIVTGDYAKGIRGGQDGSIERITVDGMRARYEKGVRRDRYPQSYNDTRRDGSPGKYPGLDPALRDEHPEISRIAHRRFVATLRRAVRTGGV